jgi:ribonuclease D
MRKSRSRNNVTSLVDKSAYPPSAPALWQLEAATKALREAATLLPHMAERLEKAQTIIASVAIETIARGEAKTVEDWRAEWDALPEG